MTSCPGNHLASIAFPVKKWFSIKICAILAVCLSWTTAEAAPRQVAERPTRLTASQIQALDRQLIMALDHYYADEHRSALILFTELARKAPTRDILFWMGNSAVKVEAWDAAADAYHRLLAIDPGLQRVRLELGMVYLHQGRYTDARQAFEIVLDSDPPPTVRANIERLLKAINGRTRKFFGGLRLSQGFHWDSNVSTGPSTSRIDAPAGGFFRLGAIQQEVEDGVSLTRLSGQLQYDPGARGGFLWQADLGFYQSIGFTHHEFDFSSLALSTGPRWQVGGMTWRLPVHFTREYYGGTALDITYGARPGFTYQFSPEFSLNSGIGLFKTEYDEQDRAQQEKQSITAWLNPLLTFNGGRTVLSINLLYENSDAESERYSYMGYETALGLYQRAWWAMDFSFRYKFVSREYADPSLGWIEDRADQRHDIYAAVSRQVWGPVSTSLYAQYIENRSNTGLYDYNKRIYGWNISLTY